MKKMFLYLAIVGAGVFFTSCGGGGGLESDIRKLAKLDCDIDKLEDKTDEASIKKMEALKKEKEAFEEKLRDKYEDKMKDKAFREKARQIGEEAEKECK